MFNLLPGQGLGGSASRLLAWGLGEVVDLSEITRALVILSAPKRILPVTFDAPKYLWELVYRLRP